MQPQKTAILIFAHTNPNQLRRLCQHLSNGFDVYLHLDLTCRLDPEYFRVNPKIRVSKKIKTHWGSLGMVHAALRLMSLAEQENLGYDRYVLISGQDVPLVSNATIQKHFDENPEVDFIECQKLGTESNTIYRAAEYHYLATRKSDGLNWVFRTIVAIILRTIQKRMKPRKSSFEFYTGSNWMDLTGETVRKTLGLVKSTPEFLYRFKHTLFPEEMFFQTATHFLGIGSCSRDKLLRYIDWEARQESPKTLRSEDLKKLQTAQGLFARKLDERVDQTLIDDLYARI